MSLRDDLKDWDPMYLWQTLATPHGHVVTAEEWNNYWNLMMTQGDHTSKAVTDMRDMLYETVLSDTDGAAAIKFTAPNFTATDVSGALIELDATDIALAADYNAKFASQLAAEDAKFTVVTNRIAADESALATHKTSSDHDGRYYTETEINSKESARDTRNAADELALTTHKTSSDHDGRYYTETEMNAALALKANLVSPTFTGTVGGITKAMVGLGSVDNTSDVNKPVSTAQQSALDLKATVAALNAHKSSSDHDGRYAFLANETPFIPTANYHLVTKLYQEQKIAEAVLSGISDNSITDAKMVLANKKATIIAETLAQVPASAFDFDTPVGKAGWAYAISGTGPVTEQYLDGATVKCSRVTTFNAPSAGKTQVVITSPTGIVITQVFNADGSADPITEV